MAAGLAHWNTSRFEPYAVNPPLVRMLATLPVLAFNPNMDWEQLGVSVSARPETPLGVELHRKNPGEVRWFYFVARMVCVMISVAGLVVCSHWATEIFGPRAGNMTAILWCFSPMMLGHGSLVTPDVGAAVFGILAFYSFRKWLFTSANRSAVQLGLWTGLAFSTKFTWIPVLPVCFVLLWSIWRLTHRRPLSKLRSDSLQIGIVIAMALLVVNLMYGFDRTLQPLGDIRFVSESLIPAPGQTTSANRFGETWVGKIPVPLPACLLQGIDLQKSGFESEEYARSYLCGTWKMGGWWYYYLVAGLVKLPITFLLMLGLAITLPLWSLGAAGPRTAKLWFEHLCLLIPSCSIFLLVSSELGFNRHLRYVLPALPFLIIFVSRISASRSTTVQQMVRGLLILQCVSVLWHGPHWLSYFNELSGGPRRGGRWILSSNIDWGQDVHYLKSWRQDYLDKNPFYYALYTGIDPDLAATGGIELTPDMLDVKRPVDGFYAISENLLRGYEINGFRQGDFEEFHSAQSINNVGYSIRILKIHNSRILENDDELFDTQ